jgi:chemotaxis protein MotD
LSNTANGILGTVQSQASAKNKVGHAKTAGAAAKSGDFASTVANLAGRGGEGGRKGAGLSISTSGAAARSVSTEQTGEMRVRSANSSLPAIAEALRRAGAEGAEKAAAKSEELAGLKSVPGDAVSKETVRGDAVPGAAIINEKAATETGGKTTGENADAGSGTKSAAQVSERPDADPIAKTNDVLDEKPLAFRDLADQPHEKPRAETQGKTRSEPTDLKADKAADAEAGAVPDTGSTVDVGNLLALLTAPNAAAQVAANGQAAAVAAGAQPTPMSPRHWRMERMPMLLRSRRPRPSRNPMPISSSGLSGPMARDATST